MQQEAIDYKKLRAEISLKYDIELDETSLAILTILSQELKRQHTATTEIQEKMAEQIRYSKKALQVDYQNPLWQAFWHGMGQWGLGLCLTAILTFIIFSVDWHKQRKEKELLRHQLQWYMEHYEALKEDTATKTNTTKKKVNPKNKQSNGK